MAMVVRPADLRADRELLIDFLFQHLTPLSDGRRFDWLYCGNPHGPARAWVVVEGDSGAIAGAAAAFPRRLSVQGAETLGCVLGDFCIHPRYRSLGPALQLQRACLETMDSGSLAFGYDFPSTSMVAVYKRLRIEPCAQMLRLAKPLRADRKIAEKLRIRPVARSLSVISNLALEWRDRGLHPKDAASISAQEEACGEEFSTLARQVSAGYGICVERSAGYLNWRYRAHPHRRHEILTARREGALVGYLIFTLRGEDASIVDLFGFEETEILGSLIAHAADVLRGRGVITVSAPILASHPRVALFERMGFRARESVPVLLYTPSGHGAAQNAAAVPPWFLMDGDRDS